MPSNVITSYPKIRPDRAEAGQPLAAGGGALALPRSRVWPFLIGTSGAARTTIVSQAFQTPCVVWQMFTSLGQAASGTGGLSLLYSTDPSGAQTAGAVAKPSGTPIMDPVGFRSNVVSETDEIAEHISMVGEGGTVSLPFVCTFKYVIEVAGPIFLKLSLRSAAGEVRMRGFVIVFEAGSLEELANFL